VVDEEKVRPRPVGVGVIALCSLYFTDRLYAWLVKSCTTNSHSTLSESELSVLWLTLLARHQEEHPACKNWMARYRHGYLSGAICTLFAYSSADATASQNPIISGFILMQTGFTLLVPAYLGCPGKMADKRVCVCVCVCVFSQSIHRKCVWIHCVVIIMEHTHTYSPI